MKKWNWGGFIGCLIGGALLLCAMSFLVAYLLAFGFTTSTGTLVIGALFFLLIVVAGLMTALVCQGNCIDALNIRIKALEGKLNDNENN